MENKRIFSGLAIGIILIIAIIFGGYFWLQNKKDSQVNMPTPRACTEEAILCPDGKTSVSRTGPDCEFAACPAVVGIADKIIILSPKTDEIVSSPVAVSGKARGSWFFEGSFPVEIYDSNDKLIAQLPVNFVPQSENDTWMSENFVDFDGRIEFSQPATDSGYMLFKKDNPSDNRELDESFKLPIKFGKNADISNWQTYRNEKYGFEFKYPGNKIRLLNIDNSNTTYFSLNICSNISCFMNPNILSGEYTGITNMQKLVDSYDYSYCRGLDEKGQPKNVVVESKKFIKSIDGSDGVLLVFNNDGCKVIQYLKDKKLVSFKVGNSNFDDSLDIIEVVTQTFKFIASK